MKTPSRIATRVAIVAVLAFVTGSCALAATKHPDLTGPWMIAPPITALKTVDGLSPPLRAEASEKYRRNQEAKSKSSNKYDTMTRCVPPGVPRLSLQAFPWAIVQGLHHVLFVYEWNHLNRNVYMDEAHFDGIGPTYLGQSVGKWDGNTLEVDTNSFNDFTLLDDSGLPHSDQLETIERYRLRGGNTLELSLKITDPQSYLKPWETKIMFKKVAGAMIKEDYCLKRVGALKQ
jgi:hypothetical protein